MYRAGDAVAHPGHGGCIVSEIRTETRQGVETEYLVLRPQGEHNILIYVPLDNVGQIGVREIMSERRADHLLSIFSQKATEKLGADKFKRHRIYQDIVRGESLDQLAALIRELATNAKLCMNDKALLSRAEKRLFSEIALVKGLGFDHILHMAESRMSASVATAQ